MDKIRVLVVDDSALVRRIISDALERDPDIEVVGTANNGKNALFKSFILYPDVITMDVEMPVMNGLEALREIMKTNPKPVIMLSSLTDFGTAATFKALEYGAVDFVPKPQAMVNMKLDEISALLIQKVKAVAKAEIDYSSDLLAERIVVKDKPLGRISADISSGKQREVVAIGTSTGGPSALLQIFRALPENFHCPVLVVQHMPEGFTTAFAERLDTVSALSVKEAEHGDLVEDGCAYLAPGHSHMRVVRRNSALYIELSKGDKVSGHRPSIDAMFDSVAESCSDNSIAVIMTGMGRDGANGVAKIYNQGGYTVAQDQKSSVVYGMNRVAVDMGVVKNIVPLSEISKKIVEHL